MNSGERKIKQIPESNQTCSPSAESMLYRQNVNMHYVRFEVPRLRLIPDGFPQTCIGSAYAMNMPFN